VEGGRERERDGFFLILFFHCGVAKDRGNLKFRNLVFLNKSIPYDSFKFPPSGQWLFCMFPMFPIASPFLLYVLAPNSSYFKPYR
jgi:hypothetical protein